MGDYIAIIVSVGTLAVMFLSLRNRASTDVVDNLDTYVKTLEKRIEKLERLLKTCEDTLAEKEAAWERERMALMTRIIEGTQPGRVAPDATRKASV